MIIGCIRRLGVRICWEITGEARWKLQTNTVAVRVVGGYRKMVAGGWTVSCDRERGVEC